MIFAKNLGSRWQKNALSSTPEAPKRRRKRMVSDAEVIRILICFHFNSFRNFKHYYLGCVCRHWRHLFPKTFSYNRFVEVMPRCFIALTMFLRLACFGQCSGISFVDSTCIPVIHNRQQFSMKVFKEIAEKGKIINFKLFDDGVHIVTGLRSNMKATSHAIVRQDYVAQTEHHRIIE